MAERAAGMPVKDFKPQGNAKIETDPNATAPKTLDDDSVIDALTERLEGECGVGGHMGRGADGLGVKRELRGGWGRFVPVRTVTATA